MPRVYVKPYSGKPVGKGACLKTAKRAEKPKTGEALDASLSPSANLSPGGQDLGLQLSKMRPIETGLGGRACRLALTLII
jgi:hypothetical protein